jgi:hypothetical protein
MHELLPEEELLAGALQLLSEARNVVAGDRTELQIAADELSLAALLN